MTDSSALELSPELRVLEAVLFASSEPVSMNMLIEQFGEGVDVSAMLLQLKEIYSLRGVNLVETDGAWSFRTAADLAGQLKITRKPRRKLPRAASEVLAIIAYHQPITRAEIESIRGVETSRGTLDILLELGWVRPGKHRETPGRPLTWQTTQDFLSHFNMESLKDLPGIDELKSAGLLDARPVMANLPRENSDADDGHVSDEDQEFASWIITDDETSASDAVAVAAE